MPQAGYFGGFPTRFFLTCLQTGCGKSTWKSIQTACAFAMLHLISDSLIFLLQYQIGCFYFINPQPGREFCGGMQGAQVDEFPGQPARFPVGSTSFFHFSLFPRCDRFHINEGDRLSVWILLNSFAAKSDLVLDDEQISQGKDSRVPLPNFQRLLSGPNPITCGGYNG